MGAARPQVCNSEPQSANGFSAEAKAIGFRLLGYAGSDGHL